jgi:hypothetical protein
MLRGRGGEIYWEGVGQKKNKEKGKGLHRGHRVHREENPRVRHPPTAGLGQPAN